MTDRVQEICQSRSKRCSKIYNYESVCFFFRSVDLKCVLVEVKQIRKERIFYDITWDF